MQHLGSSLNIAYCYGAYEEAKCVGLVMELLTGGELFSRIRAEHYSEKGAIASRIPICSAPPCLTLLAPLRSAPLCSPLLCSALLTSAPCVCLICRGSSHCSGNPAHSGAVPLAARHPARCEARKLPVSERERALRAARNRLWPRRVLRARAVPH